MRCEAQNTKVVMDGQELTLVDAVRLSAELTAAIRQVIETKNRLTTSLVVMPEDAEWELAVAKLNV